MKLIKKMVPVLALFLAACSNDYYTPDNPVADVGELTIAYRVDGEIPVRSVLAQTHEKKLERVHLLFFKSEGGEFVAHSTVPVSNGKNTFSIDAPENLEVNVPHKVLAVGNADTFSKEIETAIRSIKEEGKSYNDAMSLLYAEIDGEFISDIGKLPLFGFFVNKQDGGESTFTVLEEDGVKNVKESKECEFLFSRAACRFDIHNLVANVLDIRYARVVNSPKAGYYFTDGKVFSDRIPEFTAQEAPSGAGYKPVTEDIEEGVRLTQRLEASLYGFPNIVNTSVVNDKVTTALMIVGYYIDPATGDKDTELTYYRFNLANLGESQVLNRNYCYRAIIKGVKRRGFNNEEEAYHSNQPIFEYDVHPAWNTTDDNVVTDKDGNFLIVNQTHLTFNGDVSDADCIELRVSASPDVSWKIEPADEKGNSNEYFSCEQISNQAIKCGPKETNNTSYVRYGYYLITATNSKTGKELSLMIYLQQMSNSSM